MSSSIQPVVSIIGGGEGRDYISVGDFNVFRNNRVSYSNHKGTLTIEISKEVILIVV